MFEGKPPVAQHANLRAEQGYTDEELLSLTWDDILARLNAARDLRAILAHVPATARSSFDALAARHLAEQREMQTELMKQAVNLVASGNCKDPDASNPERADGAQTAFRGTA